MMIPQLIYAESPDRTGEVACAVSLVPTFDKSNKDEFSLVKDEKPKSMKVLGEGSDFHFIFLVDRSGSMGIHNRM